MITNFILGIVLWWISDYIRIDVLGWKIKTFNQYVCFLIMAVLIVGSTHYMSTSLEEVETYFKADNKSENP